MKTHAVKLLITLFLQCEGSNWLRQPDHEPMETFNNPIGVSKNVVLPSVVGDLPRARDILPGHTLIRPDLDSLRSAIRYPNKELEYGAKVYGNIKSIGVSVGNNERIINTGFRRSRDYDGDEDNGVEAAGRKYKKVDTDSSDENYLNFKSDFILKPSQNFLISNNDCQPEGDTDCSPQEKPKPKPKPNQTKPNSKQLFVVGAMFMEENNGVMRSNIPITRKDYHDTESRNIEKKLIPVHSNYVLILADDESAKKKEEKKFDESNEEDGKTKINSHKIGEFSNVREQPLRETKIVLRGGKSKPIPVLINPRSRAKVEKESYIPPQKLINYLNTRNDFDQVKISDRAPTIQQLIPASPSDANNNIRKWWFYNQDDYKPFLN